MTKEIIELDILCEMLSIKKCKLVNKNLILLDSLINQKFWIKDGKLHSEQLSSRNLEISKTHVDQVSFYFHESGYVHVFKGESVCFYFEHSKIFAVKEKLSE